MRARPGSIQAEIRQRVPFRSRSAEALVALLRTTDLVRRRLAGVVEPHGVTLQQYNVLRILRGAAPDGLPTLDIGARMIEAAPGVTRLLDRLQTKGLVARARCRRDRRQVLCRITPAGRRLLARLDQPVAGADRTTLGVLPRARLAALTRSLDAVRAGLYARAGARGASPTNAAQRSEKKEIR